MAVSFRWPWMGVAIPVGIIGYLQSATSYLAYREGRGWTLLMIIFEASVGMIWLSYYLAIETLPGSPPAGFQIKSQKEEKTFWRKYCLKCKADKPERAHHCKSCGRCILKMDHHCPWTMNCVGYRNLPHFTRFLTWVLIGCGVGLIYHWKRLTGYYHMRNLPSYLIDKWEMSLVIIDFLLLAFVEFTIFLLYCRTIDGLMSNVTTIEDWEQDRMRRVFFREEFWTRVRQNYALIHSGKPFPELTSWKINYRELPKDTNVPLNFSFEDLVFPYDLGSGYQNMVQALGPMYQWMWPWGGPAGDGLSFPKTWWKEEDELKIPFPIDGDDFNPIEGKDEAVPIDHDPDTTLGNFPNQLGETLGDFGVDITTENYTDKKVN